MPGFLFGVKSLPGAQPRNSRTTIRVLRGCRDRCRRSRDQSSCAREARCAHGWFADNASRSSPCIFYTAQKSQLRSCRDLLADRRLAGGLQFGVALRMSRRIDRGIGMGAECGAEQQCGGDCEVFHRKSPFRNKAHMRASHAADASVRNGSITNWTGSDAAACLRVAAAWIA